MGPIILQKERKLLFFLSMFIGLLFISRNLDNDIWFLLSDGCYVMNYGWPTTDPLSMHQGLDFVMQQWLSAVIFWQSYVIDGESGPIAVVCIVSTLAILAYYKLLTSVSEGNQRLAVAATTLIFVMPCLFFMVTRPQIFSLLIFILTMILLEKSIHTITIKRYLGFFLLSILLINFHAAMWPLMLILCLPYLAEKIVRLDPKGIFLHKVTLPWHKYIVLLLIIAVGGFFNPYGIDAMTYTSHSYGVDLINSIVSEMHPLTFSNPLGKVAFCLMGFLIFMYSREKFPLRWPLLSLGMAILALSATRSLSLFLTIGLFPVAYYLRYWQAKKINAVQPQKVNKKFCVVMMILILLTYAYIFYKNKGAILQDLMQIPLFIIVGIILIITIIAIIEWKYGSLKKVRSIPIRFLIFLTILATLCSVMPLFVRHSLEPPLAKQAVDYIIAENPNASPIIWTGFNQGGYVEFRGLKPYLDPRAEVFLKANNHQKDILQEYQDLETATITYQDFLARYDFDYILTRKKDLMYNYLKEDPHYELVLEYDGTEFGDNSSVRLYKPIKE
ncbi:hypothetical protein [Mitsuokella sp. WILCCON 0060]|uniref:hypothetical protein n=1 Tax=Mitsuokella sp. WILCCON 0060 TaxID=3345341 RepID=UPI003F196E06